MARGPDGGSHLDVRGGFFSGRRDFIRGRSPFTMFLVAHVWPGGPLGLGGLVGWGVTENSR